MSARRLLVLVDGLLREPLEGDALDEYELVMAGDVASLQQRRQDHLLSAVLAAGGEIG